MAVKAQPEQYHTITPYLYVKGAAKALDYYKAAFGAVEIFRMAMPDGRIGHCEFKIGDSVVMMADEFPEGNVVGPQTLGNSSVGITFYGPDVDAVTNKAVSLGATIIKPLANQFYGDRTATLRDPFGHKWTIATHVEDVTPEEMERRMAAMSKK